MAQKKAEMNRRQACPHIHLRHSRVIHYTGSELAKWKQKQKQKALDSAMGKTEKKKTLHGQQTAEGKCSERGERAAGERR